MTSPFHDGELNIQKRAGVQRQASRVGRGIQESLPDDWAAFLREQYFVAVGSVDAKGQVWASILIDQPGFLDPLDSQTLEINTRPIQGDPLEGNLAEGQPLGLVAINFAERQRMRLNGRVRWSPQGKLQIRLEQVFGNCPKYIQTRLPDALLQAPAIPSVAQTAARLNPVQRAFIGQADTFFIASAHPQSGIDVSHRGGNPGFIQIESETEIAFPDYSGNMMFNTLGNLATNPNSGLVFLDFEQGRTLQLSGRAAIQWDQAHTAAFPGAERVIIYQVQAVVEIAQAIPLHFRLLDRSRYNPS